MFRVFFKEKHRSVDVDGDTLSYTSSTNLIMVEKNGKTVAMFNISEIIGIKKLFGGEDKERK